MNLSIWLVSTVTAATALLIGWACAVKLRQHAAWENALVRAVLLLLLVLPVGQTLAPRLPGARWLEQQRTRWAARWAHVPTAAGGGETPGLPETDGVVSLRVPASSTLRATGESTLAQGLLWAWIIGTVASLCRLALGLRKIRGLLATSELLPSNTDQHALESCARMANVPVPSVRAVAGLTSPVLVGCLRPCVLIPADGVSLSREVWLHELAHLRRGDLRWLYLGQVTCALWWFHPLVWTARRRLERSAENVCDDLVVLWTQDPAAYATQLLSFVPTMPGKAAWPWAGVAMADYRSELGRRIDRMLEPGHKPRVGIGRVGLASLLMGAALGLLLPTAICASRAQTIPPVDPTAEDTASPSKQVKEETVSQAVHDPDTDAEEAKDEAAIERKLTTVIPHVNFHAEPLSDALEFLRGEAQRLDTTESNPVNRGVNIFLKLPAPAATASALGQADPTTGRSGAPASTSSGPAAARVTLDLSQRPLKEILNAVAGQVGMKVKVERYAVSLVPRSEMTDRLITAQFTVAPAALGAPAATSPAGAAKQDAPNGRFDVRAWLEQRGLTFPPGSSAVYLPDSRKLVIRDTKENIERVKVLLPSTNLAR